MSAERLIGLAIGIVLLLIVIWFFLGVAHHAR